MRYIVLNTILFFIIVVLCNCTSSKKTSHIQNSEVSKIRELQIAFLIGKPDFSYQFKFLNKSQDTMRIMIPKLYHYYCTFKLFDSNFSLKPSRCASIKPNSDIESITLLPNQEQIIEGDLPLKAFFCSINDTDLISYLYYGSYKIENKSRVENGTLTFEIQPTKIAKLDSIVLNKKIF